jgi:hypothetical protein
MKQHGMVICPRCKSNVDELEPIPVSALEDGGGATESAGRAQACSRCVHEILEG